MALLVVGLLILLWALSGGFIHLVTRRMNFRKKTVQHSALSSFIAVAVCVSAIYVLRASTPEVTAWFQDHPYWSLVISRLMEAPLAFLVSLPVFLFFYGETLRKTVPLGLVMALVFFVI